MDIFNAYRFVIKPAYIISLYNHASYRFGLIFSPLAIRVRCLIKYYKGSSIVEKKVADTGIGFLNKYSLSSQFSETIAFYKQ